MRRARAMRLWWVLGAMLAVSPLTACDNECLGCGAACPDLKRTFDVTLFELGTCAALPTITNTLSRLTVLRQDSVGSQTLLVMELENLDTLLDIGLSGTLCAPAASSEPYRFNVSFVRRDAIIGPVTIYTLDGTFLGAEGREPTVSATLSITFSDSFDASRNCSKQVLVSSLLPRSSFSNGGGSSSCSLALNGPAGAPMKILGGRAHGAARQAPAW